MHCPRHPITVSVLAALLFFAAGRAQGADEAPFGVPDAPAKKPANKEGAAPKAAPAKAAAGGGDEDIKMPVRPDPAVEAILATNPTTPAELTRAAKIMADLQRPDLAKAYLKKVLAAKLDQKQLAGLVEQFGSPMFVSMADRADLNPEGKQLAEAALGAAEKEARDPQRMSGLIKQLQSPSADARYAAAEALREARGEAVGPLLSVLADANRAAEHPNAKLVLTRLGPDAIRPLTGALESPNPRVVAAAAEALGTMEAKSAIDFLLAPSAAPTSDAEVRHAASAALARLVGSTPSAADAARLLTERAGEYFNRNRAIHEDLDGQMELWTWDETKKAPVAERYPTADARRILAARYAREAHAVLPSDTNVQLLYLATMLEEAAYAHGLDAPLPEEPGSPAAVAASAGPKVLEGVLSLAMKDGHPAAAAAAARILGSVGNAADLLQGSTIPSPLVDATRNADRRLRLAAAEAILRLKPSRPFAGSNQVTEALGFLVHTSGRPRAIVADPQSEEANRVGGYLTAMGYQVDTATNGRDVIRLALASPDYEVTLVASSLDHPTVDLLLQQLRHDCRSALLPVGVLARDGQMQRSQHQVRNDPLAAAFVRPHRQQDAHWIVEQLLVRVGPAAVPAEARAHEASQSLALLMELAANSASVFDVHRYEPELLAAQKVPALAAEAAVTLGRLGTARSQKALVDQASRAALAAPVRKAALIGFQQSVEKYGVLLTIDQIKSQYDRYNESSQQDPETQQILGQILDTIEAPSLQAKKAVPPVPRWPIIPPPSAPPQPVPAKPAGNS